MARGLAPVDGMPDKAGRMVQTSRAPGVSLLEKLDLSPEERLLLTCARLHLSQAQQEELAGLVAGPMDWDQLLHKAAWHNITPLVFHHLKDLAEPGRVPPAVMERLKAAYMRNVVLNLQRQRELRRLQKVLEAQGVPVILLKGAALVPTVYKDAGLRPMADLDLLVPEEWVHVAQNALEDTGYSAAGTTEEHHRHLPGLWREGTRVLVEIHRHVVNKDTTFYFDVADFWARAQELSVPGRRIKVLAPEDLLIHLAVNFFQDRRFHSNVAMRQLCDVAESLRFYRDSISWTLFLDNVRDYRLGGPVGCVMYLARELLDAPLPDDVGQQLWPSGLDQVQVERFARRRVLDTQDWVAHSLVDPGKNYGPIGVAATVLRRLFPSRQALARRYQRPASGFNWIGLYLSSLKDGAQVLRWSIARPAEAKEDVAIDRWHHSMYGSEVDPSAR